MKFIETVKGKEQTFVFKNKKAELEYIEICEIIWGCVPCDVIWATETTIYKTRKQSLPIYTING